MCLSRDHVIVTCIFAYLLFFFISFKVIKTARCKIKIGSFFHYFSPELFTVLSYQCVLKFVMFGDVLFFVPRIFPLTAAETKINLRVCITCAELLPLLAEKQDPMSDPSCRCSLVNVSFY